MKSGLILITLMFVNQLYSLAQEKPIIIKASSTTVDIRDGETFTKGAWRISPEIKPDIYTTSNKNAKVTFYTNLDSISFTIKPNAKYNFIILLNNKDSAYTQIVFVPGYLETLKKADKYNLNDNRTIPNFTYQTADNANLSSLRNHFKLDSIAGTGNEVSQILNLMHWIHNYVPHDGIHNNPMIMNAESMITVCRKENRGLNCRGLAITLNECYLSMGFKSRYVTCLPKDSLGIDNDCHVINMVYSNMLHKWVWIDPTFEAYVMNENGDLLGIEEVRERIIEDKPLILNPDANWNHKTSKTKEDYLYNYMAKNLYILECPLSSEYDLETQKSGKTIQFIRLLPLDFFKQKPDKEVFTGGINNSTFISYKTNNSKLFWEKP
jgi:hypothetical protein